jgi:HEAT repeat protein
MSEHQETYLARSAAAWKDLLDDEDPILRRLGVYALGEIGPGAQAVAPRLQEALADPVPLVRVWAAAALARVDPGNEAALRGLIEGLKDEQYFIRSLAAWHIGRLGPDFPKVHRAEKALQKLADDPDLSVRCEARIALQKLGGRGRPPEELHSLAHEEE